jgi:upstream activation factor subunit UAF30
MGLRLERFAAGPYARQGPHARQRRMGVQTCGETGKGELMAKTAKKKTARKANAAFMKPMTPSPALAEVIGSKPMPRTEVTKKLWAYIKKNGLQDSKNRRNINADAALKPVFSGKATVSMFEMTKLVSKHLK